MIHVLADRVKSIRSVVGLEIPSFIPNENKLSFMDSLEIIIRKLQIEYGGQKKTDKPQWTPPTMPKFKPYYTK